MSKILNRKTILKLYNGEMYPAESICPKTATYRENCNVSGELYKKICIALLPEHKHLAEEYCDAVSKRVSEEMEASFLEGFSLGLKLTAEALLSGVE